MQAFNELSIKSLRLFVAVIDYGSFSAVARNEGIAPSSISRQMQQMEQALNQKTGLIDDEYFLKNAVPLVGNNDAETALNRMKVIYYPNTRNFGEYEKAALKYYSDADAFDPQELMKVAWIFSEHVENKNSLKKATEWAEKSVMKSESAESTYILAVLYDKTGNKEGAKVYAKQ